MTPAAIIALIRDVVILIALALLIWLLVSYGKDVVKVADMKAVQQQITANAATVEKWRKEQTDANVIRDKENTQVAAVVAVQHDPIRLCRSTSASAVPSTPASPASHPAASGGPDPGVGEDLRSQINAFELKFESDLTTCRSILNQWPR